jgi:hypothetical protein
MTTLTIIKFFFNLFLVFVGTYAILHEKELAKFERKAIKCVKAFFKAIYLTIKEKEQKETVIYEFKNDEYEEMLASLNKASKLDDVLVA